MFLVKEQVDGGFSEVRNLEGKVSFIQEDSKFSFEYFEFEEFKWNQMDSFGVRKKSLGKRQRFGNYLYSYFSIMREQKNFG